jgi:hypothetical protein
MRCRLCKAEDFSTPLGEWIILDVPKRKINDSICLSNCGLYLIDVHKNTCIKFSEEIGIVNSVDCAYDEMYIQELKLISRELKINKILNEM